MWRREHPCPPVFKRGGVADTSVLPAPCHIGCATGGGPVRGRPIPEVLLTVLSPCLSLATAVGGVQMAEWVDSPEELGFSRGSLISELWCLAPLARHHAWGLFRRNELTVFVVSSRDG